MKPIFLIALLMVTRTMCADGLPIFTTQPVNQTVTPGSSAFFTASATGATGYQWMFNGTNIPGAIGPALTLANVQAGRSGYYMVMAMNATGVVPSQMAYLSLDYTFGGTVPTGAGTLPFSNTNNTYFGGQIGYGGYPPPPTNGTVQIIAGPQLDQMQPVGAVVNFHAVRSSGPWFTNGYYNAANQPISTIMPGQPVYYSVEANFSSEGTSDPSEAISTVMLLQAGTNGTPAAPAFGLEFPSWPEWPDDPWVDGITAAPSQIRVVGETFSLTNTYSGYTDFSLPSWQWRKDGVPIGNRLNFTPIPGFPEGADGLAVLTITNAQPSDAGIYDVDVRGNNWFISSKITVSIQTTNGQGLFQNPRNDDTNFIASLIGAATRNYDVQWSTNLTQWHDLVTLSNVCGNINFTNASGLGGVQFYRTILMP